MLRVILAATLWAGASAASATSIEPFTPTASNRTSIVEIGCPACARKAAEKAASEAEVKLELGEQIIEVREVGGKMMIYRTEGWLGGSPVTMVRKATDADLVALGVTRPGADLAAAPEASDDAVAEQPMAAEAAPETEQQPPKSAKAVTEPVLAAPPLFEPVIANIAPGIDVEATTSALGIESAQAAKPFDASEFELRLN